MKAAVFAIMLALAGSLCAQSDTTKSVQIVYGSKPGWIARHSAEELAEYIKKMTGLVSVLSADKISPGYERVFLIGSPEQNPAVGAFGDILRTAEGVLPDDGFVVKSFSGDECKYTVLAGQSDRASLYAVYDYLERFCKVGFFEDGEYVPKLSSLPFDDANTVQKPHFRDRHYLVLFGHWGIKRFHAQFWTWEEWKRELDFLAKKKINMSRMHLRCSSDPFRGDVAVRAFPEIGPSPSGYSDSAGWPNTYNWPEEYRTELTKRILDYGRKLGIKFIYLVAYGDVPIRYRAVHPEVPFMPDDMYGPSCQIRPEHPVAEAVTKKYLSELIKTFGTDHLYFDTPYSEASPGATLAEKLQLKTDATNNLCRILKEVDPQAMWVWDTWGFTVSKIVGNGELWTKENIKKYVESNPTDMTYIFDNNSDLASGYPDNRVDGKVLPMYLQHDYLYGKQWAFSVLHSYAGDDTPHGRMDWVESAVKALVTEPKAKDCRGFFIVPEKIGDNDLYYQFVLDLAWNPSAFDRKKFFKDYAVRRFGSTSCKNMSRSVELIAGAVHNGLPDEMNYCYYRMVRCNGPVLDTYVPGSGVTNEQILGAHDRIAERMDALHNGLQVALKEKDRLKGNKLYENYIVEYGKHYLADVSNLHMIRMYKAFKAGDKAGFEQNATALIKSLDAILEVLAARQDYSLADTVNAVMEIPGTNPATPKMIRQNMINGHYTANDNYEQMRTVYLPKVKIYVDEMRKRLEQGERKIDFSCLQKPYDAIDNNWRERITDAAPSVRTDVVGLIEESIGRMNHKSIGSPAASKRAVTGDND